MKRTAIIGTGVLVLGLLIFLTALFLVKGDITRISTKPLFEERQMTIENRNQSIVIEDSNIPFVVEASSDNQIHLIYEESEAEFYRIEEGEQLTIRKENHRKWYDYIFNFDFQMPSFTLQLPTDFQGELSARTSNAKIKVERVSLRQLILETSNAPIELEKLSGAETVDIRTSNGKIAISDSDIAGELRGSTSSGTLTLDQVSAQSLLLNTSNGKIKAYKVTAGESIELISSNGRIEFSEMDAGKRISLTTSNAKISGTLLGSLSDFTIEARTSNAKSNLPEIIEGGDKALYVKTSNGEIDIQFAR